MECQGELEAFSFSSFPTRDQVTLSFRYFHLALLQDGYKRFPFTEILFMWFI